MMYDEHNSRACQVYEGIINTLHTHTEYTLGRLGSLKLIKVFVGIKQFYVLHRKAPHKNLHVENLF